MSVELHIHVCESLSFYLTHINKDLLLLPASTRTHPESLYVSDVQRHQLSCGPRALRGAIWLLREP